MMDADGGVLFCLVDICRARIGLAGNMQRAAADDRTPARCDAEFCEGHFHRHKFVLSCFCYAHGCGRAYSIGWNCGVICPSASQFPANCLSFTVILVPGSK